MFKFHGFMMTGALSSSPGVTSARGGFEQHLEKMGDSDFLADLEGLGEDSDEEREEAVKAGGDRVKKENGGSMSAHMKDLDDLDSDDENGDAMEEADGEPAIGGGGGVNAAATEVPDFEKILSKIAGQTLDSVASLRKTKRYQSHMARVEECRLKEAEQLSGPLESDPEYQLIVSSNRLVQDMDEEIITVHRFVVDLYSKKFPELESLVPSKVDYARTVQRIGNETDLTLVDLTDLLPTATVMVVSVTGSSTSGKPLTEDALREVLAGCEEMMRLCEDRNKILRYVESRMNVIAPNTCALVGSGIASQLLGLAGGLTALSRIPGCNIALMGQEKKALHGFSAAAAGVKHGGVIYGAEVVLSAPPALQQKALKVVASKVALTARIDAYQQDSSGEAGRRMREEVEEKIEKWQEPPKGKEKKALPVPDDAPRKKRGGKRVRKFAERFQMTEVRKDQNRMGFGSTAGEYGDSSMGMDFGMLGVSGGKLRLPGGVEKKGQVKKRKLEAHQMSSGATSGMASSLVFTPTQGIELHNPIAQAEKLKRVEEANKKWFDQTSGFMSAKPR